MNIYEQIQKNRRATWFIVTIFIALFLFIGLGLDRFYGEGINAPVFTTLAVFVAIVSSYSGYRYGDRVILSSTKARELNLNDPKEKQWQNVVDEMSIASGISRPKTFIINDSDPNAFATGRDPDHASIAVTRGL